MTVDDTSDYTERDLDRVALSHRAARLADRLQELVGQHGHDVPPAEWLGRLVAPVVEEADELRALAVRYAHRRGLAWPAIAAATGLDPEEARRRWAAVEAAAPEDPHALVLDLERWYIRRLTPSKAAATVSDPLRRILDGGGGPDLDVCLICRKYTGGPVPAWAGWAEPPGGHLVDDRVWWVSHAPTVFSPLGSLLVESRRHYLDYAEMTPEESASYGRLLSRLMPVIKLTTGAERVHVFSNMDGAPHFHAWLIPRRLDQPGGRGFLMNAGQTTEPEACEIIGRMRSLLAAE
jgi:diadenosine tetraphosphate (Ap4A) HIT family hydrolase